MVVWIRAGIKWYGILQKEGYRYKEVLCQVQVQYQIGLVGQVGVLWVNYYYVRFIFGFIFCLIVFNDDVRICGFKFSKFY